MKNKYLYIIGLFFIIQYAQAQVDTSFVHYKINFDEYLKLVGSHNLGYTSEKFNVDISEANVQMAKVFTDPSLALGWTENKESGVKTDNGYSAGLAKTIELGGKRKARIDLAKSESEFTKALLAEYFRTLRADATLVFLDALRQNNMCRVKQDSYKAIKQLADADSIRSSLGSIMEIDAIQSKVEASILFNDVIQVEGEWKNALNKLVFMTGNPKGDTVYFPLGSFKSYNKEFVLKDLITQAQDNRADLLAALGNKVVSQKMLTLAQKERIIDIDVNVGLANSYLFSSGASAPSATGITAGIGIPLKFSNFNKAAINVAHFQVLQADEQYKQVELQVKTEICQALQLYLSYCKQVGVFENGMLEHAENVRKGKVYSYERGETSLLEVLNAQRTFNDIQEAYYNALYNRAASLVELEKASGIWDLTF